VNARCSSSGRDVGRCATRKFGDINANENAMTLGRGGYVVVRRLEVASVQGDQF
jgi:hypothetical protein